MPATYTVKQVAKILGYSTNSIYQFLKENRIKGTRVGKGRFRIPEDELNRLLLTKPKSEGDILPSSPATSRFPPGNALTVSPLENLSLAELSVESILGPEVPSLFNWFIGAVSILLGISLFLFDFSFNTSSISRLLPWLTVLKLTSILAGAGFLLCHTFTKDNHSFQKIFHILLILSHFGFSILLGLSGYIPCSLITATIGVFLIFTLLSDSTNEIIMPIFNSIIFSIGISRIVVSMGDIQQILPYLPSSSTLNLTVVVIVSLVYIVLNSILLIISSRKIRPVFWAIIAFHSFSLIAISFFSAEKHLWYPAILYLFSGCFTLLLPFWSSLRFKNKLDKIIRLAATSTTLIVFLTFLLSIYMVQANLLSYAREQLLVKVKYASDDLAQNIASIDSLLKNASLDPSLIQALSKTDSPANQIDLTSFAKTLFSSNQTIRHILILNAKGDAIAYYPYNPSFYQTNFSQRDYFKQVISTRRHYHSEIFDSVTQDPVITTALPIFDNNQDITGVLVSSLNLEAIQTNLQNLTEPNHQEYFAVVDRNDNFLIHPNPDRIGKPAKLDILTSQTQRSGIDTVKGYNQSGTLTFQVYSKVNDPEWKIILQAPAASLYEIPSFILISFYLTIILYITILIVVLVVVQKPFKTSPLLNSKDQPDQPQSPEKTLPQPHSPAKPADSLRSF